MSDHLFFVPDAPPIPGLAFRGFRGEEDFPAMLRVINAWKRGSGVERTDSLEDIRRNYRRLDNCDPDRDLLMAEVDGDLAAYTRVTWWDETEGDRVYLSIGFIDPAYQRRGLGTAMLRWNEHRLRNIASTHPPGRSRRFHVFGADTEEGAGPLYTKEGYEPFWWDADMVRPHLDDIPDAPLPPGLEVRTPRPDQMRQVWEADKEAFRDHPGYSEPTENDYEAWLEDPRLHDHELWRIAWDGDLIAGQVRSFINEEENEEYGRKRGYTEFISTCRPWRRQGVARALLCLSLHAIKERGMTEGALGVHTDNPRGAFQLYESVGFRVVKTWTSYRKPLE